MSADSTPDGAPATPRAVRGERRRAATRGALVEAAQRILAERGTTDVSIQEITEVAGVGFGSFYNHFATKDELFGAAIDDVLEQQGRILDETCAAIEDPAEVFAASLRITGRLVALIPQAAPILTRGGLAYVLAPRGLGPRARRDIEAARAAGRLHFADSDLAVALIGGALLGFLQLVVERPGAVDDAASDQLAELMLRMLGMGPADAADVATRPLPAVRLPPTAERARR